MRSIQFFKFKFRAGELFANATRAVTRSCGVAVAILITEEHRMNPAPLPIVQVTAVLPAAMWPPDAAATVSVVGTGNKSTPVNKR